MKLENIYINLRKCSEDEQKHIFSLLPESLSSSQYKIDEYNFILDYEYGDDEWWVNGTKPPAFKQELTYPEFIKLFEEPKKLPSELLKEYFKNTPREQVLKDWESTAYLDNTNSPKIREFFEDSEEETFTDKVQKLEADKAELLEILEKVTDLLEVGYPGLSAVRESKNIIQKHKQ